jgi:hypothetical protein
METRELLIHVAFVGKILVDDDLANATVRPQAFGGGAFHFIACQRSAFNEQVSESLV